MSNLFNVKTKLNELKSANFSANQHQFITTLLEGTDEKTKGWNIETLTKAVDYEQIANIISATQEEIKRTSYISFQKPHFNFKYINGLKNIVSLLDNVQKKHTKIENYSKDNPEKFKKIAKMFDTIFEKTSTQFNGTIMLPVSQGFDARLGNSGGECFGYIADWAKGLLENKAAFGVQANQPPPFSFIKLNSPLGKKYLDSNHLAFLTENISLYQSLQKNTSKLMATLTEKFRLANKSIGIQKLKSQSFYKSIEAVADELISYADHDSNKIYNLNIMGYLSGHALGFCKIDTEYHFFDSNTGWYRFENSNDFQKWLPFYFKTIGYNKLFGEYDVRAYSKDVLIKKVEEEKTSTFSKLKNIAVYTLLSPILLVAILAILTHLFIIRGFRYAIKAFTHGKDSSLENEPVTTPSIEPRSKNETRLTKELDYLDLAINNKAIGSQSKASNEPVTSKDNSSQLKGLDYLDLAVNNKRKAFFDDKGYKLEASDLSSKKKTNVTQIESNSDRSNSQKLDYLDFALPNKTKESNNGTFFDPMNKNKTVSLDDSSIPVTRMNFN